MKIPESRPNERQQPDQDMPSIGGPVRQSTTIGSFVPVGSAPVRPRPQTPAPLPSFPSWTGTQNQ